MFYAISVIIIQAAVPYGYTDQQGGIAMAVITIAGYAGGAFVSIFISFIRVVRLNLIVLFIIIDGILCWTKRRASHVHQALYTNGGWYLCHVNLPE